MIWHAPRAAIVIEATGTSFGQNHDAWPCWRGHAPNVRCDLRWLGEGGLFKCALPRAVVLVVPSYGDGLRNVTSRGMLSALPVAARAHHERVRKEMMETWRLGLVVLAPDPLPTPAGLASTLRLAALRGRCAASIGAVRREMNLTRPESEINVQMEFPRGVTGYEPAARKGVECRLGGSILKIAFQKPRGVTCGSSPLVTEDPRSAPKRRLKRTLQPETPSHTTTASPSQRALG